jgi:hypothetical protein
MVGDGQISFDMFVQSMVTLKTLTDVFKGCVWPATWVDIDWILIVMGLLRLGLSNSLKLSFVSDESAVERRGYRIVVTLGVLYCESVLYAL